MAGVGKNIQIIAEEEQEIGRATAPGTYSAALEIKQARC